MSSSVNPNVLLRDEPVELIVDPKRAQLIEASKSVLGDYSTANTVEIVELSTGEVSVSLAFHDYPAAVAFLDELSRCALAQKNVA